MKKLSVYITTLFVAALFSLPATADLPDKTDRVVNVLEDFGYEVSVGEDYIEATHEDHLDLTVEAFYDGMLFTSYFITGDYGHSNMAAYLELMNELNQNAVATRYYIDFEGDFLIEGFYPGKYRKKQLEAFLESLYVDEEDLYDRAEEINEYLD